MSTALFKKIIQGDEKAFEEVFTKHFKSMCFYAKLHGLSLEQAKEIVQFTFLKFWEIRSNLEPSSPVESYLYRAVRNNSLDYLRSKKIHEQYIEPLNDQTYDTIRDETNDLTVYIELEKKFKTALDNFPPQMKEVFVLSRIEGLKHKEIGQKLNLSTKTIETHISRAIRKLRIDLKEFLPFLLFIFLDQNM